MLSISLRETGRLMLISPNGSWYLPPTIGGPSHAGTRSLMGGPSHSNSGPTLAPLRGNHPSTVEYSYRYSPDAEPGRQQRLSGEQAVSGTWPLAPHPPASIGSAVRPPITFIPTGRMELVPIRSPRSFTFSTDTSVSLNSPWTPNPELELEMGLHLEEDETTVDEQSAALQAATVTEDAEVLINPLLMETVVLQEDGTIDPSRPTLFSDSLL
jgi:hypothetical protein